MCLHLGEFAYLVSCAGQGAEREKVRKKKGE